MITHEFSGAVSSSSGLCSPVKALIATPTSVARLHRHRDCFCSRDVLRSVASAFYCARHLLDLVVCSESDTSCTARDCLLSPQSLSRLPSSCELFPVSLRLGMLFCLQSAVLFLSRVAGVPSLAVSSFASMPALSCPRHWCRYPAGTTHVL